MPDRFAPPAHAAGYTNKDKLEIVKLTLEEILAPTVNFLDRRQRERGIALSSRNLKKEWSKSLRGYQVKVLHPHDIERAAWREGSFQYLEFTRLKVVGDKVVVELQKAWAQGTLDFKERTERSSIVLEFRKDGGIFRREIVSRRYQSLNPRRNTLTSLTKRKS